MFRLVDRGWDKALDKASRLQTEQLRIVCPFIKLKSVERFFNYYKPADIKVLTRFNLRDFYEGVSDIEALEYLLKAGAEVRGIRGLHSKLYLFGTEHLLLTSANLTEAALLRNAEFGCETDEPYILSEAHRYFERLWGKASAGVSAAKLAEWKMQVTTAQAIPRPGVPGAGLPDHGAVFSMNQSVPFGAAIVSPIFDSANAFVKFFGTSTGRSDPSVAVLEEVQRSGSHWACSYPASKAPRAVRDDDVMYISRLVQNPNDILIFGRAKAMRHDDLRDMASRVEIAKRPWKEEWPRYIRVHHAEFLAGSLCNGVSLNQLMRKLGHNSFKSTQRNVARGEGNVVPSRALMQKAHVQLTSEAFQWLDEQLQARFDEYGKIPAKELARLDWPKKLPQ
jgi:hypothetical protein